jgi:hypothetical protein
MKHLSPLFRFSLVLIVWSLLISCQAARKTAENENSVSLSALAKKPARYEGKEIQLEGVYLGWEHADCLFPPKFLSLQLTRSDWAFSDGRYCCFVTGTIPAGLASVPAQPVPIKLTAFVKRKDAQFYLEYVNAQIIK